VPQDGENEMIVRIAAVIFGLCVAAAFGPALAQQYQGSYAPYPAGGGLAPATSAAGLNGAAAASGAGMTAPGEGVGGGMAAPSEGVGGGVADSPYSSYGAGTAVGISGGGLNAVTQNSLSTGATGVAPNGETYKSLGISGY
jgi:hypothetical protein